MGKIWNWIIFKYFILKKVNRYKENEKGWMSNNKRRISKFGVGLKILNKIIEICLSSLFSLLKSRYILNKFPFIQYMFYNNLK